MSRQFKSLAGCLVSATLARTNLANSVLHLFKSALAPDPTTPLATYTANECDFDGYAAITLAAWLAPGLAEVPGYQIVSPLVQFAWSHVSGDVANAVGGAYLVNSNGDLIDVVTFTAPIPMGGPGQVIPISLTEVFSTSDSAFLG